MKKFYSIILLLMLGVSVGYSQTYLTTPLLAGNGSAGITFNVTAHQGVFIEDIKATFIRAGTAEIWYNPTAISGPPTVTTAAGWTQIATGAVTASGTGLTGSVAPTNLFMPAGSTFGFYVGGVDVSYTNGNVATPSSWTDGTISIDAGTLVGYGGGAPNPTFHIRMFNGAVGYSIAPTVPNNANTSDLFTNGGCPGLDSVFAVIGNSGTNQIDSVWVNWIKNGTVQTAFHHIGLLDTFGGLSPDKTRVFLGMHTFTAGITDTFEVWTTLPNGLIDTLTGNDSTVVFLKPQLPGGTYTIGGASPDYATFALATADLNTIGICGPIVFNVRQGTYNEQVSIGGVDGSSSTNTITFQSDPANTTMPLIQSSGTSAATNYVLAFNAGAEYIIFDSLHFKTTGTNYSTVVNYLGATNYITINNCMLEGNAVATTSTRETVLYQDAGLSNYNTITNNTLDGGSYGIYMRGSGTAAKETGNNVSNNSILNASYYQVYFYYQDSLTFDGNKIIQRPTSTSVCYGIYTYYCDDCNVRKNSVTLNTTSSNYGMMIGRWAGTSNEVSNNMIVTSANSTGTSYGMHDNYSKNVNIYHNSVNIRGGNPTSTRALFVTGSASTSYGNNDIRNNIFVNSLTNGYALYVVSGASTGYLSNLDNNIYYGSGTNYMFYARSYADFATYQAAVTVDSNSYFGAPGFFSQSDLHLRGALAADSGANLGIMTDIDGDARPILPSTGYDIGADEYIPPTCPSGYSLSAYNIATTTADLGFIAGAADTGWIFEYGAPGYTPGTGTSQQSSNDSTTITGLTPLTNYEGYVRGICSLGDTSIYVGPIAFKTRCVSSLSGIYTVNSTLPTAGTNYASFADVMIALNNCGVSGPTTFNVKQGTYTEQVDINSIVGVSAVNTVTFQGDPTNTSAAILTYAATTTAGNYVVQFDGAENIILNDLTITAGGVSYAYVLRFPAVAKDITVKNCILNGNSSGTTSALSAVIYNDYNTAASSEGVTIDSNQINDGSYAIYWRGGNSSSREIRTTISNNTMHGFSYYGAYLYYSDSLTFDNNDMEQLSTSTSFCYGIYTYYADNIKVRGNKLVLNTTSSNYGLMAGRYAGLSNEVSNNMIVTSANACATCTAYGLYDNYSKNVKYYHNSVNVRGGDATRTRALYSSGSTSTTYGNNDMRNNIFANAAGGHAAYVTSGASSSNYFSKIDYNIYFSTGMNVINYSNIDYTAIATYQAASLRDSNSYFSTPQYIAGDDLHVVGVVANDNGDSTLGIMIDFDGDVRPLAPTTGYDIGADEYIPPSCPSPYSITLDTVLTTSATFSWTNGPADSIWELQYGAPGFTLGTGTIVNSTSNPTTISGLTHSTCYEVWIRSVCTVGDTSLWSGPFNFCSKCGAVTDYCTSFESTAYQATPFCWNTYINSTSTAYIYNYIYVGYTGSNSMRFYNSADASATMMLIAPEVSNLASGTHRANFWARGDSTIYVGTMSDPTNPGTFTYFDTIDPSTMSTSGFSNYKVDFSAYSGTDTYVVFLWDPSNNYDFLYIDDYCWEAIPSCEKAPSVTVLNSGVDSTSINLGWNFDTTQVSYIISYGPAGYDPVTNPTGGQTTTSTTNFVNVGGLRPLTEYCFWVKAVCTNGDTSFWDGPHCGETGCPDAASLPYFDDFSGYVYNSGEQLPLCWEEGTALLGNSPTAVAMGSSLWTYDGFANVGSDGSAKMQINYTRNAWFVSPTFDLGSDPNTHRYIEFDIAMTQAYNTTAGIVADDDTLAFLVSYNAGLTWDKANILELWDTGRAPSNTGDHIVHLLKGATGKVKFAFYGISTISNNNNEWFVDNFSIKDTVFTGIDEVNFNNNFSVFPNPNTGVFTVLNEGDARQSNVKLLDIQGRVVYDNQFFFSKNSRKQIEVSNLNSGVYILLLQSEGKLEQHRIVIQ